MFLDRPTAATGTLMWMAGLPHDPTVGPDGTQYGIDFPDTNLRAVDAAGNLRWNIVSPKSMGLPDVDPGGKRILLSAMDTSNFTGYLEARRVIDGALIWSLALPTPGGVSQRVSSPGVRFTQDGTRVYFVSTPGGAPTFLTAVRAR